MSSTTQSLISPPFQVRLAKPNDYPAAAQVLTRAFAHDPAFNWYGVVRPTRTPMSLRRLLPKCSKSSESHLESKLNLGFNSNKSLEKTMRKLRVFQEALLRMTVISGGQIAIAVIPPSNTSAPALDLISSRLNGINNANGIDRIARSTELIVGVAIWLRPGQTLHLGIMDILRTGGLKVLWVWGLVGLKRIFLEFIPAIERSLEKAFRSRNLDRLDSWHLLEMAVDPKFEGLGICSLMMKDGFTRTTPKPIHLEATKARTRDIYAHFGFEVIEEHWFGVGHIDGNGVSACRENATGFPEWVMTKWSYAS